MTNNVPDPARLVGATGFGDNAPAADAGWQKKLRGCSLVAGLPELAHGV